MNSVLENNIIKTKVKKFGIRCEKRKIDANYKKVTKYVICDNKKNINSDYN